MTPRDLDDTDVLLLGAGNKIVAGKGQPQYLPLPAYLQVGEEGAITTRWHLSEEEVDALHNGADLYLTCWTFGGNLQPVRLTIGAPGCPTES